MVMKLKGILHPFNMKLLFPYSRDFAVYFPPGKLKDGGSCEFMTPKCEKSCGLMANSYEKRVFFAFRNHTVKLLSSEILKQLNDEGHNQFHWFAAGDCPKILTDKILQVINILADKGIIQNGFTRNIKLWKACLKIKNTRIALTVESRRNAKQMSAHGLVSLPDYKSEYTYIYIQGSKVTMCGGGITCGSGFVEDDEVYPEDCTLCCEDSRGCFTGFKKAA